MKKINYTNSELNKFRASIARLEYQNKLIQAEIEGKQTIRPWYPVNRLAGKIGNNKLTIKKLKEIIEGKYV